MTEGKSVKHLTISNVKSRTKIVFEVATDEIFTLRVLKQFVPIFVIVVVVTHGNIISPFCNPLQSNFTSIVSNRKRSALKQKTKTRSLLSHVRRQEIILIVLSSLFPCNLMSDVKEAVQHSKGNESHILFIHFLSSRNIFINRQHQRSRNIRTHIL